MHPHPKLNISIIAPILWIIDMILRFIFIRKNNKQNNFKVQIQSISEKIIRVSFEKKDFKYNAG